MTGLIHGGVGREGRGGGGDPWGCSGGGGSGRWEEEGETLIKWSEGLDFDRQGD